MTINGAKLNTKQMLMLIGSALAIVISGFFIVRTLSGGQDLDRMTRTRLLIDSETLETFRVPIRDGDLAPITNPRTGERTLYPAEACHWTADGRAKLEPTLVFVKEYAGSKERTLCPDCGRPVIRHNPLPPAELMVEAARAAGHRIPENPN